MSEQTIKEAFLEYRGQIEAGTASKTLTGAFAAGARAVLEMLLAPYTCFICEDKILEIEKQIEAFSPKDARLEKKMNSERDGPKK